MCVPGLTHSLNRMGSADDVTVQITSARAAASCPSATAVIVRPSSSLICSANARVLCADRPQIRISRNGRTRGKARKCASAWTPVPKIARTSASARASASVAAAVAQAVRILVTGSASAMQLTAPVVPVISDHDALMPRPSGPIRIAEDADQLGPEHRKRRKLAGHGPEHFVLADRENLPQRLRPLARRQRDHRRSHGLDAARIVEQLLDLRSIVEGNASSRRFLLNPAREPAGASCPASSWSM